MEKKSEQKIVEYFKRGIEKGFSKEHIKKVLLEKGYNEIDIDIIAATIEEKKKREEKTTFQEPIVHRHTVQKEEHAETKAEEQKAASHIIWVVLGIIVIVAIGLFVAMRSTAPDTEKTVAAAEQLKEDLLTLEQQSTAVDAIQQELAQELEHIATVNATIEEKQEMVALELQRLNELNVKVKQERDQMKKIFLDLLALIERQK